MSAAWVHDLATIACAILGWETGRWLCWLVERAWAARSRRAA